MKFSVDIKTRDFNTPVFLNLKPTPLWFAWSAFGGPEQAALRMDGTPENLLTLLGLLRSPVTFSDPSSLPVWWGYVSHIILHLSGIKVCINLDLLYNKVKVSYSFISPDNKLADRYDTAWAEWSASEVDFGTREIILKETNIDDDYAEGLRDTFLSLSAWPRSVLTENPNPEEYYAELHCSGWFSTLGWLTYSNSDGFYANYGPGPGTINFGRPNWRQPAQSFTPGANVSAKYIYFKLRANGAPAGPIVGRFWSDSAGVPNTLLAGSTNVLTAGLPTTGYAWTRFEFVTAYALSSGTKYWTGVFSVTSDAVNNLFMATDENCNYYQDGHYGMYFDAGTWKVIPSITAPGTIPHLKFRVVCINDTGTQLLDISTAGNQFFSDVVSLATSLETSPYRAENKTCLQEIIEIMQVGTSNNRMVLASVDPNRRLTFYEQPTTTPTAYMDIAGRFFTQEGIQIKPYQPPVGQYIFFRGSNRLALPFDQYRTPSTFVEHAKFNCLTGSLTINNS